MTIHDKAQAYSRSHCVSLETAYRELSKRGAESRRRRRGFADYGKTVLTKASAFWWNKEEPETEEQKLDRMAW